MVDKRPQKPDIFKRLLQRLFRTHPDTRPLNIDSNKISFGIFPGQIGRVLPFAACEFKGNWVGILKNMPMPFSFKVRVFFKVFVFKYIGETLYICDSPQLIFSSHTLRCESFSFPVTVFFAVFYTVVQPSGTSLPKLYFTDNYIKSAPKRGLWNLFPGIFLFHFPETFLKNFTPRNFSTLAGCPRTYPAVSRPRSKIVPALFFRYPFCHSANTHLALKFAPPEYN